MVEVSVLIPSHDRRGHLARAVASVLAQEGVRLEVVVVDDGSVDGTSSLLLDLERRHPGVVRPVFQPHRGVAAARNTAIRTARGAYLAFLDSDDRFLPGKLAKQLAAMRRRPDVLVSHTREIWYRQGRRVRQRARHRPPGGYIFERCLEMCVVGMSTVMARRELFDRYGLFDERLPCCEDYELWLRVSRREPFLLVDEALTRKDGGRPDQLSQRYRLGMDRYRILALVRLLENWPLRADQHAAAVRELVRKCRIYGNGCLKHGRIDEGVFYLELARRYQARTPAPDAGSGPTQGGKRK